MYSKLIEWIGMCRQFIREFSDLDTPIFMFDKNGEYVVRTLEQVYIYFYFKEGQEADRINPRVWENTLTSFNLRLLASSDVVWPR